MKNITICWGVVKRFIHYIVKKWKYEWQMAGGKWQVAGRIV